MNLLQKYMENGVLVGNTADMLLKYNGDMGCARPFIEGSGRDERAYITLRNKDGGYDAVPILNTHATLRKDEWKVLDDAIVKAAKERLKLVADLRGAGLTFNITQGWGKTILETETMGDINDAAISMDGLYESPDDRPESELGYLPLPITTKDFQFSARQIATSRNGSTPIDTTSAELAGRKVAEAIEKLTLGLTGAHINRSAKSTYTYGGGTVMGLTNFTSRLTQTLTAPTAGTWTGSTLLTQVIAMRTQSIADFHYGPWRLYVSPNWDAYLDEDFKTYSDRTLRERIGAINGITSISTLDFLTGYDMVLLQMTSNVVRMVIGMDITTLQWDTKGGMQKNFKVMAIMVPQLRADFNSNTGIVHGGTGQ